MVSPGRDLGLTRTHKCSSPEEKCIYEAQRESSVPLKAAVEMQSGAGI